MSLNFEPFASSVSSFLYSRGYSRVSLSNEIGILSKYKFLSIGQYPSLGLLYFLFVINAKVQFPQIFTSILVLIKSIMERFNGKGLFSIELI